MQELFFDLLHTSAVLSAQLISAVVAKERKHVNSVYWQK